MELRMSDTRSEMTNQETYQPTLEINLNDIIDLFRQKKIWITSCVLAAMIVMATVMIFTPNQYTSHASILPSGKSSGISGLMGLASNFGFGGAGSADENSSALYPSILNSDLVRDGVLDQTYEISSEGPDKEIRLNEYFEQEDPNQLRAALSRQTLISTHKKLGIVRLRVETTNRYLSQEILREYICQLEDYLNNKRRSRANENQTYLSNQLLTRSAELREAEDRLEQFMKSNRNWATSTDPELNLTLGRLKREVRLATETNLLLTQQMELARLEAQKDIPIVRLLDTPSLPTTKSGPSRTVNTIFAGLTAFILMSVWILLVNFWNQLGFNQSESKKTEKQPLMDSQNRISGFLKLRRSREEDKTPVA